VTIKSRCLCGARVEKFCVCGKGDKPHYLELIRQKIEGLQDDLHSDREFIAEVCDRLRLALTEKDDYFKLFYEVRDVVDTLEVFLDQD